MTNKERRKSHVRPELVSSAYTTVAKLAARWDISPAAAYRLIETAEIAHMRVGVGSIRIPMAEVERYERERLIPHAAA
jgi:hypothetical protein